MKRITMLSTVHRLDEVFTEGKTYDLDDYVAAALLSAGKAEQDLSALTDPEPEATEASVSHDLLSAAQPFGGVVEAMPQDMLPPVPPVPINPLMIK